VALFGRRSSEATVESDAVATRGGEAREGFLPSRGRRPRAESFFMRLIATGGIIGIGTALAAILGSQDVAAWIIGLVVSIVSVVLAALLWSSRRL
jgi:hypothetical protein